LLSLLQKNKFTLLSLFIVTVTAVFSTGFLHPDEHFQILELLKIKLEGKIIDPTIFNWDYHLRIRSWLQPFIYYTLLFPVKFLDGFQMALLIRLFNGLFGLYALLEFIRLIAPRKEHYPILLLTLLTWFVPLLMVRTNSESLSTSLFLLGFSFYEKKRKPFSMIFLSLSFLVRYQMALVICPLILLDLLRKKICPFTLIKMSLCFILMVSFGSLVDYWGYGVWSLTPYNYFFENLIQDKASSFGVSPFYYYLYKPLIKGVPPLSLLVFACGGIFIWKRRTDSLSIALLCFFIVHSLIPHKEVRFLNFIYVVMAVYSATWLITAKKKKLISLFIILNFIIMMKTSLFPAHSRIGLYQHVAETRDVRLFTPAGYPPFRFTMPFYMNREIETKALDPKTKRLERKVLSSTFEQYMRFKAQENCKLEYAQYPAWIKRFNFFNWLKRSSFHAIWSCQAYKPK